MNLPNKITLTRIGLTFVFMLFLFSNSLAGKVVALVVFLVAALTDYLDGFIAKKYRIVSDFGRIMDPVADKILTLAAFLAFVEMKLVPAWMVVVIIMRELIITAIRIMALTHHNDVLPAGSGGRHKTFLQMLSILVILIFIVFKEAGVSVFYFWNPGFEYWYRQLIFILMLVTVILTAASGISYLAGNKKYLFNEKGV
ncbi:MAG: CDP-diacylglycerol--glycerol-3-phosphate 3-phosphatidyltransferase [Candidatus Omnitrophota bacterium]